MSEAFLDLSGRAQRTAQKDLLARLSALLGVTADRLVLAASPEDAERSAAACDDTIDDDRSAAGVLGLEETVAEDAITLIRLGPADLPMSVLVSPDAETAVELAAELSAPSPGLVQAGLDALKPAARLAARADRDARDGLLQRCARSLESVGGVRRALLEPHGLSLEADPRGAKRLEDQFAVRGRFTGEQVLLFVPDAAAARALADWLGAGETGRAASVRRTTKETDIAVSVDLDGDGASIATGVRFFDHMLEQIARHGGLKLDVVCQGDVDVDAHHTIEDVCLALGEALREALGDKRGVARFGFETPMDETRASVWVDLSGRPYCRFDGAIPGERVGDFPVEMCAHAFRSLAETMKAAIHVQVDGENAHHMVESCFKSFGRALRMAKTVEGDALPSTKGVL